MAERQIAIRIGLDGKDEVRRGLKEVGDDGQAAMARIRGATDQTSNSIDRQMASWKRLAAAAKESISQDEAQRRFNALLGVRAAANGEAEAAARVLKPVADAAANAERQLRGTAGAFRLIIGGLTTGTVPIRELATEAERLSVDLGEGQGLTGMITGAGRALTSIISPAGAAGAAVAAGVAVALKSYDDWISKETEVSRALVGVGRGAGATADEIESIAQASAQTADISVAEARQVELAFIRTGKIGAEQFQTLAAATDKYALITRQALPSAAEEIARALADPAHGADILNQRLGFLDDRTRQYIQHLVAQGEQTKAATALQDAFVKSIDAANVHLTAHEKIARAISNAWSNAWESVGKFFGRLIDGPSIDEKLKSLRTELDNAIRGPIITPEGQVVGTTRKPAEIRADIDRLSAQNADAAATAAQAQADERNNQLATSAAALARQLVPGPEYLKTLKDQKAQLGSAIANPAVTAQVSDLKELRDAYDAVSAAVSSYLDPAVKAQKIAEVDVKALTALTPAQKGEVAAERERLELAGQVIPVAQKNAMIEQARLETSRRATVQMNTEIQTVKTNTQSNLDLAGAYLQSGDAAFAAEARRQGLNAAIKSGINLGDDFLRQMVSDQTVAGAKALSQLTAELSARTRLNDEVASGALTYAQAGRQLQIELALRPLLIARALAEGEAKEKLTQIIDEYSDALRRSNKEGDREQSLQILASQKEHVEYLNKELDLVGATESQRNLILAQLTAEQDLRRRNIDLGSSEAKEIIANAGRIQELTDQLHLSKAAVDSIRGAGEQAFDRFGDLIREGNLDFKSWRDAGLSAIRDILNEFETLAIANPLKNALFGGAYPTLGNLGGTSFLDALFSSGSSAAGAVGNFDFAVAHSGGRPGIDLLPTRPMPIELLASAPRFHSGINLASDEIPAILKRGERVLNIGENRRYSASGGYRPMPVASSWTPPKIEVTVRIDGARGSAEIEDAVNRGTSTAIAASMQALQQYDAGLERRVIPIVQNGIDDPRYHG